MVSLAGKRIFVVEDNIENRIIIQLSLIRSNAVIEFDRCGNDTVKRLMKSMPIDLILLDLMLPFGDSGYDIFSHIRGMSAFNGIPIVAVSAADPFPAITKCRQLGFNGFIAKPIDDDLFSRQLCQLLAGESVWYAAQR